MKVLHHAPLRIFCLCTVLVKKSLKIGPLAKCHEILRTHSSYFSMHLCKKPNQNSIYRYHFPFFRILRFLDNLKIRKIFIPWKKILKLGEQRDIMLLSMPAKNRSKIRSLGPNFGLMSPQKKGIYSYKIGNGILAYYRGGEYLAPTTPQVVCSGLPWGFSPTLTQAFPSLCGLISHGIRVIDSSVSQNRNRPISADFWCDPSKSCCGLI